MELTQLLETQRRFAAAISREQLKAFFLEESKRLGFECSVYALRLPTKFSNAQVIMLDGYPEGWVKRYFEAAHYTVDPVMAWCAQHIIPVRWSNLVLETAGAAQQMMAEAAEYGLRDGVTMPEHSPQGELGILSLSLDAPPERAHAVTERALLIVQLLAIHLHQAVRRRGGVPAAEGSSLTARERECLS